MQVKMFFFCAWLALANPARATPDIGEAGALKGLNQVWLSVQALVFESNLAGGQLRPMQDHEADEIKAELQSVLQNLIVPDLRSSGLSMLQSPIMIEDAWRYYTQAQEDDSTLRITREFLVNQARRNNRKPPRLGQTHLRLFIEIQQDGLDHVGRLELSLIAPVRLDTRSDVFFYTTVWLKSEEAVPLGIRIDRETLRTSVNTLLQYFETDLKASR